MLANRRVFLAVAAANAAAAAAKDSGLALGNRTHIFARPAVKEKLIWCFSTLLGCGAPAVAGPILAWKFPGGGSLSVEFTEDALDERQARHGAWLEVRSDNPEALKKAIVDAGLAQIHYAPTNVFYFAAPGGQVLGIVPKR